MATGPLFAVTGATGGVGGRVARRLAERGANQVMVVRTPERAPRLGGASVAKASYDEAGALRAAFDGVATLFLVSASEAVERWRLHATVIDAAAGAGVERIVYASFLNAAADATFTFARDHWTAEEHIRATGIRATFLRNSLYQDILPYYAGADGVIRGPAGDGAVGAVARDDIADVAAEVLLATDGRHDGRTYDLTGPEALTLDQVAEELSAFAGRGVRYERETVEAAFASRAGYGAPDWEVTGWVTTYTAIAAGELDTVSDDVAAITGHPAMRLRDFLAANPGGYSHLFAAGSTS